MKMSRPFVAMTTLATTVLVASALAQDSAPFPRASGDVLLVPQPGQEPGRDANVPGNRFVDVYYKPAITSMPAEGPFVQKLNLDEVRHAHEAEALAKEFLSNLDSKKRAEIQAKLNEILGKQFDARQRRHKLEIEALEAQVKKLRELVNKRQESRDDIISRRLEQIVRDSQGLGW